MYFFLRYLRKTIGKASKRRKEAHTRGCMCAVRDYIMGRKNIYISKEITLLMSNLTTLEKVKLALYFSVISYVIASIIIFAVLLVGAIGMLYALNEVGKAISALPIPGLSSAVSIPWQVYAGLILAIIGVFAGFLFEFRLFGEAKKARLYGLSLSAVNEPLMIFVITWFLIGLGLYIAFPSVTFMLFIAIGALALLVGFRLYFSPSASRSPELPLAGSIIMIIGAVLMYIIGPSQIYGIFNQLAKLSNIGGVNLAQYLPPLSGPFFSELHAEGAAILILTVFTLAYMFLPQNVNTRLISWLPPISAMIFSAGLAYFGFSLASVMNNLLSLTGVAQQFLGIFSSVAGSLSTYVSILQLIFVLGLLSGLLLGISGLLAFIALLAWLATQLSPPLQTMPPPPPPPPPT